MSVIQCLLASKSGELDPQQIKGIPHPDIYGIFAHDTSPVEIATNTLSFYLSSHSTEPSSPHFSIAKQDPTAVELPSHGICNHGGHGGNFYLNI